MKQYIIKCLKKKAIKSLIATTALMFLSQVLYAQDDYGFYLQKARQRLAEGDCEGAQRNYNVYKDIAKKTDKSLERMLAECGSDAPLTPEELKSAGFRFLKQNNKVTVINQSDNQETIITNVSPYCLRDRDFIDGMLYYGGKVSDKGLLNGVVVIKGNDANRYLACICEGKIAYPILRIGFYDGGLYMSLQEGCCSYGCIYPSWNGHYRDEGLCKSMREVYGQDFSDSNVLREIYYASIDLASLENSLKGFVRSGNQLDDSWSDDPKYTDNYEGFEPIIEGYRQGDFDEKIDQYRPINNGRLLYSQTAEFYCDGEYDPYESRYQNGHALHVPHCDLNPNHFRVIFSLMAVSNKGWCQGHADDEQFPFRMDCGRLGVRLNEDGSITIETYDSKGKDHYYVTGYNYPINRYIDIDMEYDHGQFIINGHRFNISIDLKTTEYCDYSFHSVNYSIGNAFKGYIKGLKIYSYTD